VNTRPAGEGLKKNRQPMQLRDVAAALRKQDDVNGVLAALKLVDGLIEAAPNELGQYAGVQQIRFQVHHSLCSAAAPELAVNRRL